jgi:hypothetical protein
MNLTCYRCTAPLRDFQAGAIYAVDLSGLSALLGGAWVPVDAQELEDFFEPHVETDVDAQGRGDLYPVSLSGVSDLTSPEARSAVMELQARTDRQIEEAERRAELADAQAKALSSASREKLELARAQMGKLSSLIMGINAYLGIGECERELIEGDPAPDHVPVSIRQLILYADEECALSNKDRWGSDSESMDVFYKWLRADQNYTTILPEQKCLVAMRPRRNPKEHNKALTYAMAKSADQEIFLLARNGGRVTAIFPELVHDGDVFFPTSSEMHQFLDEESLVDEDGTEKPNSAKWAAASQRSEGMKRQLLRVMMLLQGLFDRSELFRPTAGEINVARPDERSLRIVRNGEVYDGDHRPSFSKWMRHANLRLHIGSRVLVDVTAKMRQRRTSLRENESVLETFEKNLSSDMGIRLFTIEKVVNGGTGMSFYLNYFARAPFEQKKRTTYSCVQIWPGGNNCLNLDAVTESDLRYYLTSRRHRHEYVEMLPLVSAALSIKREERERDEAFAGLACSEFEKITGRSDEGDRAAAVELTHWWRFKNQFKRSVDSESSKAMRMVLRGLASRRKLAAERLRRPEEERSAVTRWVEANGERFLLLGYRGEGRYVVLRQARAKHGGRGYLTETSLSYKRGTLVASEEGQAERSSWRHAVWETVVASPGWEGFDHWALSSSLFTKDELDAIAAEIKGRVASMAEDGSIAECLSQYSCRVKVQPIPPGDVRPIVVDVYPTEARYVALICDRKPGEDRFSYSTKPKLAKFNLAFWRNGKGELTFKERGGSAARYGHVEEYDVSWVRRDPLLPHGDESVRAWIDQEVVASCKEQLAACKAEDEAASRRREPLREVVKTITSFTLDQVVAGARREHEARHGSELAWRKVEKKTRENFCDWSNVLLGIVTRCVLDGTYLPGETLGSVLARTTDPEEAGKITMGHEEVAAMTMPELRDPDEAVGIETGRVLLLEQ